MLDNHHSTTVAYARRNTLGDIVSRSAARKPDGIALVDGDVRHTYGELATKVERTANALAARGVAKGDRIALLSRNNYWFVVVSLATARLGAISVPVNFMLAAHEVGYILEHASATGLIAEEALLPIAEEATEKASLTSTLRVLGAISPPGRKPPLPWESVEMWAACPAADVPQVPIDDDDVVQLMYTSGTESRPKGVMMTNRSLITQYTSCIIDGRYHSGDVMLHALPLFHVAAQHCFLMPSLYLSGTNIILDRPDPATMLATIEAERVNSLFCPPTVWISLLRHPDFDDRDLTSLAKGYYGASIMPMEIVKELSRRLPGIQLFNFYGQTEMSALALVLPPEDQLRKPGAAGRASINVETVLVDSENSPVAPGVPGEIVHRSPHATIGYWNEPEKTADAYRDGWFHSGDLGICDKDGYITVIDRIKDIIKTGGENVASREVEEAIYQHPAVAEVAVFGVPHPFWIEAVVAVAVIRRDYECAPSELIRHCRNLLAGFKVPKYVEIVDELPKNAAGKILKRSLRISYTHLSEGGANEGKPQPTA